MTQTTLLTLLKDENLYGAPGEGVYVIKDDDVVFYVGMSECGGGLRVREHWAGGRRANEILREFLHCAVRDGLDLTVEFLSIADCQAITKCLNDLGYAEGALIALYCPVFNTTGNPGPKYPVPEKYKAYWAMKAERREAQRQYINSMTIK